MSRDLFELHPVTGYRYTPDLQSRVPHEAGGYDVHTNRIGYRCRHDPTPQKPTGVFRILVFGGGYTAGNGVDEPQRFTELLEQHLEAHAETRVQVLNFGLPGSGADQQLLGYREHARDIEHDLLLLCPHVETILRNLETHASVPSLDAEPDPEHPTLLPKPRFSLEGDALVLHPPPTEPPPAPTPSAPPATPPSLVRGLLQRFTAEVDKKVPGFHAFTRRVRGVGYPEEYADPQHPAWRLQQAILRAFVTEARAPVVLAPIPTFEHVDGTLAADPYLARFGEIAAEGRCELVNVLRRFFDEPRSVREQCRFVRDPHPTALGHTLIAEGLLPHLRRYL